MTLDQIALRNGADKSSNHHNYTPIYEKYFEPIRNDRIVLWECGYGGYHYPDHGGAGARTWREYFPNAVIATTDLHHKTNVPRGVLFAEGSQDDINTWNILMARTGTPNIFIDDGSHINPKSIATFRLVFPLLKSGGLYVWEDLESSWWGLASDGTDFKGCSDPNNYNADTAINFLRWLITDVNAKIRGVEPTYPVEWIHFYNNIAFIKKK